MRGAGRAMFAAFLLLIAGMINVLYGIGALDDANIFVNDTRYILDDLNTLGWVLIILGVIQLTGGFSLLAGNAYGRVIGIIGASIGAVGSLLSIGGNNPWWSLPASSPCASSPGRAERFSGETSGRAEESEGKGGGLMSTRPTYSPSGWVSFAGVILFMAGSLGFLYGLGAVLNDEVITVQGRGVIVWEFDDLGLGPHDPRSDHDADERRPADGARMAARAGRGLRDSQRDRPSRADHGLSAWSILLIALDVIVIYQLTARWVPGSAVTDTRP